MLVVPCGGFQKPQTSFVDSDESCHFTRMQARSVYIHVPFCAHRCGYCDFTLVARKDHLVGRYLEALQREMAVVSGRPEVETVFLGGGTPTHLSATELNQLMQLILDRFQLAGDCEFSVEANPFALTNEKLDVLQQAGVNRLSLGIQSFDATVLATLERDHRSDDVNDCVLRAKQRFQNIAFDLIFAVPGQTLELWQSTLKQAVALQPTHISTYGLTFEKGTAFWTRRLKGQLQQSDDELERAMYAASMDDLADAGFEQYEISNFARPNRRCRHNQVYWTGRDYWGFGPGAASFLNGSRRLNHRSVTSWMKLVMSDQSPVIEVETLSPEESAREAAALGLRRNEGINRAEFQARTGFVLDDLLGSERDRLQKKGLIWDNSTSLGLTREGRFLSDYVAGQVL